MWKLRTRKVHNAAHEHFASTTTQTAPSAAGVPRDQALRWISRPWTQTLFRRSGVLDECGQLRHTPSALRQATSGAGHPLPCQNASRRSLVNQKEVAGPCFSLCQEGLCQGVPCQMDRHLHQAQLLRMLLSQLRQHLWNPSLCPWLAHLCSRAVPCQASPSEAGPSQVRHLPLVHQGHHPRPPLQTPPLRCPRRQWNPSLSCVDGDGRQASSSAHFLSSSRPLDRVL
mmetsp:Transcript_22142/g.58688  ORF Transcript_22142/g.58688 Transcript_22142/m.58688 type:complete len:227 (-) Transcript_22142:3340-4020(-)